MQTPVASLPMNTFWTHIQGPADVKLFTGNQSVIRLIQDEKDLRGLPHDDPGYVIACTGVPRGEIPIVPVAQLRHPVELAADIRSLIASGGSFKETDNLIADQMRLWDRTVSEIRYSGDNLYMTWQQGRQSYATGIMQHLMGEGLLSNVSASVGQAISLIKYFSGIADKVTRGNGMPVVNCIEPDRQNIIMSNLLTELSLLQDAKLADGGRLAQLELLDLADLQFMAVRKGLLFMLGAESSRPSRQDLHRGAAYLFDLMARFEAADSGVRRTDVEAVMGTPMFAEYAGRGYDAVLESLNDEIRTSAMDAKQGLFDANGDVQASMAFLYGFWNRRYAGAYLFTPHIFGGLASEIAGEPEEESFRERAVRDGRIAQSMGLGDRSLLH